METCLQTAHLVCATTVTELSDFAVGFSRQPLLKGNRFAVVTNAGGPGIMATDASIQHGLELTTLRPETIESLRAKLPPTAKLSTAEDARAGFRKITNGVKQRAPSAAPRRGNP
jgi:acyl-CoA synthetase (NDP forming)